MKVEHLVSFDGIEGQQTDRLGLWTVASVRIRVVFRQATPRCGQEFILVLEVMSFFAHVTISLLPFMMSYSGEVDTNAKPFV